ncbi:MAG: universal stress protein [Actinomyces sp.]|nr:universal stress protein [Actinomyces sp.]MCI1788562.1 universal stress protein [Actinomyces sp.]
MGPARVPQPSLERMVPFPAHPVLVGVVPGQDPLVLRTAAALARAVGAARLDAAYVDTSRVVVDELPDGTMRHAPMDPDAEGGDWRAARDLLARQIGEALGEVPADEGGVAGPGGIPWRLWYLAGRPDRSLTHLARATDASVIVVGARRARSARGQIRELVEGSVSVHLAHHQHRPVLTVPTDVVDWKELPASWTH